MAPCSPNVSMGLFHLICGMLHLLILNRGLGMVCKAEQHLPAISLLFFMKSLFVRAVQHLTRR